MRTYNFCVTLYFLAHSIRMPISPDNRRFIDRTIVAWTDYTRMGWVDASHLYMRDDCFTHTASTMG